ncbi:hypothetical protein WNY98_08540 [Pseudoalteromonas sp. AS71]|uniref:hypothetical protein n=1 Tax=Pseudoalteromonas sp. AS71 TaxID=3135777 RepID=UPI00316E7B97
MNIVEINAMILALECGAMSLAQVVSWADELIIEFAVPDDRLFDVSTAKHINDAVISLQAFGDSESKSIVAQKAFHLFRIGIEQSLTSHEQVAQKIYYMALADQIPHEEAEGYMFCFWDELDDANTGVYGNSADIKHELVMFIRRYES